MSTSLAAALRTHQEIVRELYTPGPLDDFPAKVARLLSRTVPVDARGSVDMNYVKNSFRALREPALDARDQARLDAIFLAHVEQHPLGAAPGDVMSGTTVILSKTMPTGGFARSSIYNEFYQPISVKDELGMSVPVGDGRALCFFLWRHGRSFGPQEVEALEVLRPHIEQAYQNTETFAKAGGGPSLVEDLGEALSRGLVLLDLECRVREWSERGRRLMQAYFPAWRAEPRQLPEPLSRWVCRILSHVADPKAPPRTREPFQIAGPVGRLSVRLVDRKAPGEFLLVFEEQQEAPPPTALRGLGLTPRECIIATWLAQGKTSPEIATILGANPLTVKVHLLHIFAKLGVETRTAAALRIVEHWHATA